MTAQEYFDYAYNNYEKALDLIAEMGEVANRHDSDASYNIEIMKKQFDCLLQTMLLEVACVDNQISSIEARFIDEITDYVDILVQLKLNFGNGRPITWNNLDTLNLDCYKQLCKKAVEWAEQKINNLLQTLILADYYSEFNYLEEFTNIIIGIIRPLCDIDGRYSESEKDFISEVIWKKYYGVWEHSLEQLNNKSSESSNSLKSQYLLKKNK